MAQLAAIVRMAARPHVLRGINPLLMKSTRMATSATDQMKEFWQKNEKLGRPSSPWIIYHFHLPMTTSLTHRVTGVMMGVVLYGVAVGSLVYPGDFASIIELIKSLNIPSPIMFGFKAVAAFPLVYHYLNGIRHLAWDAGYGFKLSTQYKTGASIMITSMALSMLLASLAYM